VADAPALLRLATHRAATGLRVYEVEVVDGDVRVKI
jgi:hypothetical protein